MAISDYQKVLNILNGPEDEVSSADSAREEAIGALINSVTLAKAEVEVLLGLARRLMDKVSKWEADLDRMREGRGDSVEYFEGED